MSEAIDIDAASRSLLDHPIPDMHNLFLPVRFCPLHAAGTSGSFVHGHREDHDVGNAAAAWRTPMG